MANMKDLRMKIRAAVTAERYEDALQLCQQYCASLMALQEHSALEEIRAAKDLTEMREGKALMLWSLLMTASARAQYARDYQKLAEGYPVATHSPEHGTICAQG